LIATAALAGCGGGTGVNGVSSVPGPVSAVAGAVEPSQPTERLASVAIEKLAPLDRAGLISGTYDVLAVTYDDRNGSKSSIFPEAGAVRLAIDSATKTYSLSMNAAGFPSEASFDLSKDVVRDGTFPSAFGYHAIATSTFSDGRKTVSEKDFDSNGSSPFAPTRFFIDAHTRYLSLGAWTRDGNGPPDENGYRGAQRMLFVQGIRTDPADLPSAGTATYATTASLGGKDGGYAFDLHADFGAGTIATEIAFRFGEDEDLGGVSARGSAPIARGGEFLIPLNGDFFDADHVVGESFGGTIDGAFFGPQAAEVGGVYRFLRGSEVWAAGAFIGAKKP
jgi:hypothetical protein